MKTIISLILLLDCFSILAQTINVFKDNSDFVIRKNKTLFYDEYPFELRDSLPDGKYFLYNLLERDSAQISVNNIIMSGSYKNKIKDGSFYYYKGYHSNNNVLFVINNYKCGLLDGFQAEKFNASWNKCFLNYCSGKKCGSQVFFEKVIEKQKSIWKIIRIETFNQDTLKDWKEFYSNGNVFRHGNGSIQFDSTIVDQYDEQGRLKAKFLFKSGHVVWIEEYGIKGIISKSCFETGDGKDNNQYDNIVIHNDFDFAIGSIIPKNGYVLHFDDNGKVINKLKYSNGVMLHNQ